jgi:ketosteroid isomerase-like protein
MSETSEMKLVREMQEAASRRDTDRVRHYFHPDVELIVSGNRPDPGVYRGIDEFFGWMNNWYEELFDAFEVEVLGMSQIDDMVVAEYCIRGTGRLSGAEVTERPASVLTVRGGVIVRVYSAATLEEAMQAIERDGAESA